MLFDKNFRIYNLKPLFINQFWIKNLSNLISKTLKKAEKLQLKFRSNLEM